MKLNEILKLHEVMGRYGSFVCRKLELKSLSDYKDAIPSSIKGFFDCNDNNLTSLEGAPSEIGTFLSCENNNLKSLKDIHKIIKKMNGMSHSYFYASNNPIKSHILGVLLIDGCYGLEIDNKKVQDIVDKYLPNEEGMAGVLKCQEELFAADLDDFAQL